MENTSKNGAFRRMVTNPQNGKKYKKRFIVCNDDCQPQLRINLSKSMELVEIKESQFEMVSSMKMNPETFHDVFYRKLGTLPGQHTQGDEEPQQS